MRQPHAAVPRSPQRSEPKLMPVQGRCLLSLRALYCRRVAFKLVRRVLQAIAHSKPDAIAQSSADALGRGCRGGIC
jgi:hypothetical protein